MTVYELNQTAYASIPALTSEELVKKAEELAQFLCQHQSKYYLMLNNDVHYYTMYVYKGMLFHGKMAKEIVDVASSLGEIKSIEFDAEKVEFWIMYEGQCHAFYLFDYTSGVIEV